MWHLLFSFDGRISRALYWVGIVMATIALGLTIIIVDMLRFDRLGSHTPARIAFLTGILLTAWIGLAVSVKRLHDRDKTAAWLMPFWIMPVILSFLGFVLLPPSLILLPLVAGFAPILWSFVELGCRSGVAEANKFGPSPLPPQS